MPPDCRTAFFAPLACLAVTWLVDASALAEVPSPTLVDRALNRNDPEMLRFAPEANAFGVGL